MTAARRSKHRHAWLYYGGMASCACGFELLPDGTTRRNPKARTHNRKGRVQIAARRGRSQ